MNINQKLEAKIKTKSNYRNLNGQYLPVVEIAGRRVSCQIYDDEVGKPLTCDFAISEVEEFRDRKR